jgi:PD-(D/E)XK nuclease superfamily protein
VTEQFDTAKPEPKRDRYGRYLLPDPDSGKELPWTRATTFAKSISDSFGLTNWQLRMAVKGVAMRADLYALAAATPIDDKSKLDRIAKDAKEAAAASSGANIGSALHGFTERLDRGETLDVPEPWAADVRAYHQALNKATVRIMPEYIERIIVVPELRVAGTLDRIVQLADGALHIADVKTGKDLSYGWLEISIQLALYAHAAVMWNDTTQAYEPMPNVDPNWGIVMHVPASKGRCELYQVDIGAGWEAAQTCQTVRRWRNRRDLASPFAAVNLVPLDNLVRQTGTNQLLAEIDQAGTVGELEAIWTRADADGTWTSALTAAAAKRKQQLQTAS